MLNSTFYPTPKRLIDKMIEKIKKAPDNVLEPSAGKGDIIERLNDCGKFGYYRRLNVAAIEKDPDLRATLRGKQIKVLDSDFLTYSGPDKFDLIIANPPFDDGDKHLLKAIDIMYRGEIVFLLNAETIRNPCTNTRKLLVKRLQELNADIEFIKNGFANADAERKTDVEVALIYINIERQVEDDLFAGADNKAAGAEEYTIEEEYPLSTGRKVEELVAEYNEVVRIGTETIVNYYRNYKKVGKYIGLNREADSYTPSGDLTAKMQSQLNDMLIAVRKDFWRRCLDLREVYSRMTVAKQAEFESALNYRCDMDFTENNIRSFVLNLIGSYEQTLTEAVLDIFDKFTIRHSFNSDNKYEKNIHYFNGWKTNNAFKVGKKVIIPIYAGYGSPFIDDFNGKWKLDYDAARQLRDIDVVMNYFDGINLYNSIVDALQNNFALGISSNIKSTYFTITVYKKGTIHLTFNDEDILRRFNVAACKGKGWLPCDYSERPFDELSLEEKAVAESFEGRTSYTKHLRQPIFARGTSLPQLAEVTTATEAAAPAEAPTAEEAPADASEELADNFSQAFLKTADHTQLSIFPTAAGSCG